jgi:hypothetical protein
VSYRYYGIVVGKLKALLALGAVSFSPAVPNAHAAVWLGASTRDARTWVQAGIEQAAWQRRPQAYIEIGRGGAQVMLRTWPIKRDQRLTVQLVHRGSYWRVLIAGHYSPYVRVPRANVLTLLETYSPGRLAASAFIDGRRVRSS